MSDAPHTLGPWIVAYDPINGWPISIYSPRNMHVPGGVGTIVRKNGIGFPSSSSAAANARLIAAAPDLLMAARLILASAQSISPEQTDALAALQAAIAKAEGGS